MTHVEELKGQSPIIGLLVQSVTLTPYSLKGQPKILCFFPFRKIGEKRIALQKSVEKIEDIYSLSNRSRGGTLGPSAHQLVLHTVRHNPTLLAHLGLSEFFWGERLGRSRLRRPHRCSCHACRPRPTERINRAYARSIHGIQRHSGELLLSPIRELQLPGMVGLIYDS